MIAALALSSAALGVVGALSAVAWAWCWVGEREGRDDR
jgi:hypothetical protein